MTDAAFFQELSQNLKSLKQGGQEVSDLLVKYALQLNSAAAALDADRVEAGNLKEALDKKKISYKAFVLDVMKIFRETASKKPEWFDLNTRCISQLVTDFLKDDAIFEREMYIKDRISLRTAIETAHNLNATGFYFGEMKQSFTKVNQGISSISAAAEELSSSIHGISENTSHVADEAEKAKDIMEQGLVSMDTSLAAMEDISRSSETAAEHIRRLAETSKNIFSILKIINNISKRTHLLAVNATIEAAHAGEKGKGFAVVATEVKKLADQTSDATKDVEQYTNELATEMEEVLDMINKNSIRVSESKSVVKETVEQLKYSSETIVSVSDGVTGVRNILDTQNQAVADLAKNLSEVSASANSSDRDIDTLAEINEKILEKTNDRVLAESKRFSMDGSNPAIVCEVTKMDHIMFKKRILDTLRGKITLTEKDLPDHNCCRLGKWYNSVQDKRITSLPAFESLLDPHIKVHALGKEAVIRFNKGDFKGAMESAKKIENISEVVLGILTKLADEIDLLEACVLISSV